MSGSDERSATHELRWSRMPDYTLDQATRDEGAPWIEDFDSGLIEAWALDLYELNWCRSCSQLAEEELVDSLCGILFYPDEETGRVEYEWDMLRMNGDLVVCEVPVVTD